MKVFSVVMKIVVALAAIAGAVYVAATYGDKIVAWAKKLLGKCECCCAEEAAEEAPAEEAPAEEAESAATEADFEG